MIMTWKKTGMMLAGMGLAFAGQTMAMAEAGSWMVRARGISVTPDESATISAINGTVGISSEIVPELDFSYFLTDNVAAELILATTRHDVSALGTDLGDVDLGKVSLLPPTLTLQYHFTQFESVKPYVGAGVNMTLFYNADPAGGTVTDIDYDTGFGFALQAGMDIEVGDDWFLNADVKKLFLKTDAALNAGAINANVTLNPWVFGVGFGRRF